MPPRTYADHRVIIGAVMEPAYEVSGDAYDYATADDVVHLSIFDAMGHDTSAGLTANLAMGACRNHRRQGTALGDLGDAIERVLLEQFRPGSSAWSSTVPAHGRESEPTSCRGSWPPR
jgi:hypothetical protein